MMRAASEPRRILITGGAGFIGSCLARHLIHESADQVLVFDKLSYAATLASLETIQHNPRFRFMRGDICDPAAVTAAFSNFDPDIVVHLAAETHVDRSIDGPATFVETNVRGTLVLLEHALAHWKALTAPRAESFRFHHVSTDEVFGSLGSTGFFHETTSYDPRSPYSASKAASDHLVRAWFHTYGLPIVLTNCSNNYGPCQFPEKFIPLTIVNALGRKPLPVYGNGTNIRDWLHVEDHVRALRLVYERAQPGSTYLVGGRSERTNLDVAHSVCKALDALDPREDGQPYAGQIAFVTDRPGHDFRYAIDCSKIETELGWKPQKDFDSGIEATVRWYLDNNPWWQPLLTSSDAVRRRGLGTP